MNISEKHKCKWSKSIIGNSFLIKGRDDFQGQTFFPHGKHSSCDVAVGFYVTEKTNMIDKTNVNRRVLLLEVESDSDVYVLVRIYYINELYQLNYITELYNFSNF